MNSFFNYRKNYRKNEIKKSIYCFNTITHQKQAKADWNLLITYYCLYTSPKK